MQSNVSTKNASSEDARFLINAIFNDKSKRKSLVDKKIDKLVLDACSYNDIEKFNPDKFNPETAKQSYREMFIRAGESGGNTELLWAGMVTINKVNMMYRVSRVIESDEGLSENFKFELYDLNKKYKKGEISASEYVDRYNSILDKYVEQSGDEELKNTWEERKSDLLTEAYQEYTAGHGPNNEVKVSDSKNTDKSFDEVTRSFIGLSIPFQVKAADNGEFLVMTENSDFSFNVYVYQDPENDGFVYYVDDKYIDEKKGPFKADELANAIDERQMRSYVINRIDEKSTDTQLREQMKDLPDANLINVTKKLIGDAKERMYSIQGKSRIVLNNFTACLMASNQEGDKIYPTMYDKLKAFNDYLKQESKIEPIIKKLYNEGLEFSVAEAPTISELISA